MKYRDLQIQTQREAPNNARTEGFSFLVRAGYLTRENVPTQLGEAALKHLGYISADPSFLFHLSLPTIGNDHETFFPIATGDIEVAHCPACQYTERLELARFKKTPFSQEEQLALEKVSTPDCNTIESLANFLNIPKEQTAKALMYTRISDGKFIFVVVRGDMQASEAKLKQQVGDVRAATGDEIVSVGAVAGYASAVGLVLSNVEGLKEALIVVDDLIPQSQNLAAGANETGYHLLNTNYPRDYSAEIVADLIQAKAGDACVECGNPLAVVSVVVLFEHEKGDREKGEREKGEHEKGEHEKGEREKGEHEKGEHEKGEHEKGEHEKGEREKGEREKGEREKGDRKGRPYVDNILLALAETHHDDKGLTLPHPAAPFDVYLMHVPGKELDTRAKAEELHNELQSAGISVLFDDRDERAGVKFNDADLIGCPIRVTVGEKGLKEGMVELKLRKAKENQLVAIEKILQHVDALLQA